MAAGVVSRIELQNFRAFQRFAVPLGPSAVLVGPNNTGKSTVVSALRAVTHMLAIARRLNGRARIDIGTSLVWGYEFTTSSVSLEEENLHWELQDVPVQIRASFANGSRLRATWPTSDGGSPWFYLLNPSGKNVRTPAEVRQVLPIVAVIPPISPVERRETLLDAGYVRESMNTRLASRHFRNELWLSATGRLAGVVWQEWKDFSQRWLPEVELGTPEVVGNNIDVYYRDHLGSGWKELVWAGDGFQVFIQALFHIYRLRGAQSVVLDEPDVYLHADLQRRLTNAALQLGPQIIVATHSPEIVAEVGPAAVVWMDRTRNRAVRAPDEQMLGELAGAIGSVFNLRLARALRAKHTLFLEGEDMVYLRALARTLGALRFASEIDLATVPIEGGSNWRRLEGFAWLNQKLLRGAIPGTLILDRDYHGEAYVRDLQEKFKNAGLSCHIWRKKEIENYLLVPSAIARRTGLTSQQVDQLLEEITEPLRDEVLFQTVASVKQDDPSRRRETEATIMKDIAPSLTEAWADNVKRLEYCPAKEVLHQLNERLSAIGARLVSAVWLAAHLTSHEIAEEVSELIRTVERTLK